MAKYCGLTCVVELKGGCGKSALVASLHKHLTERGVAVGVVSNDRIFKTMEETIGKDSFLRISDGADFPAVKGTDSLLSTSRVNRSNALTRLSKTP